jgi:serine/threonine protein kinase/tetratricopeptide (TPR) repeat protein
LFRWLRKPSGEAPTPAGDPDPSTIGHYRITRRLGAGGMGVVYAARDERLGRSVAIKMIGDAVREPRARERLRREARSAARLNHPYICQVYDVGEHQGEPYVVMELLDGRSLLTRLEEGPVPLTEAAEIALQLLSALDALHRQGLLHRDLKPANVFLTSHGVKLLDFGLARLATTEETAATASGESVEEVTVTGPGTVVGTPRYMSPEQLQGLDLDARTDLFSLGVVLYEMLAGRLPFAGKSAVQILHAVLYEQPAPLVGTPAMAAMGRVLIRAMSKRPQDRHGSADAMAQEIRSLLLIAQPQSEPPPRSMTRLIVLPFRQLRADPDTEFLSFSLADAVACSLSGLGSILVRSTLAGARFAVDSPDLKKIAEEADVDRVLTGTLLRSGEDLQVTAQLVEAPAGTLLWSETSRVKLTDVLQIQDELVRRIVGSLQVPLTPSEARKLRQDVPASAKAYEFYLRGNQLGIDSRNWKLAEEMYRRSLEEDPNYALAWARLGRIHRVLAKYSGEDAAERLRKAAAAFDRALAIYPDLPLAHNFYAQLEVEEGRPIDALVRLLRLARSRSADPEVFAGLVHVCRYCGLVDASLAADREARRLDPSVQTSVGYTYMAVGDYEAASQTAGDDFIAAYALSAMGRNDEAAERYAALESHPFALVREVAQTQRAALVGDTAATVAAVHRLVKSTFRDPEGLYFAARHLARVAETSEALSILTTVVERGFYCVAAFRRDPWLDPLRTNSEFVVLMTRAEAHNREAAAAFEREGGPRLLGLGMAGAAVVP